MVICVKFKEGDRIIVKDWSEMVDEFGIDKYGNIPCENTFLKEMKILCGKIFTISTVCNECKDYTFCTEESLRLYGEGFNKYYISDDMVKPANTIDWGGVYEV
jgi:hypothetical protein